MVLLNIPIFLPLTADIWMNEINSVGRRTGRLTQYKFDNMCTGTKLTAKKLQEILAKIMNV